MLNRIIVLLASLLIFGCAVPNCEPSTVANVSKNDLSIDALNNSTVVLVKDLIEGVHAPYCAGVWISPYLILTAAHCIEDPSEKIKFETYQGYLLNDGDLFEAYNVAKVKKINKNIDLALLEIDYTIPHSFVKLSNKKILKGEDIIVVGHTSGVMYTVSKGNVSTVRKMENPRRKMVDMIQISAAVWMGNSGGGAFNKEGELIGICSFVLTSAPMISFFVHQNTISDFLKD
jgi:S1-C subfamily serine protease